MSVKTEERWYQVNGPVLRTVTEGDVDRSILGRYLEPFSISRAEAPNYTIALISGAPEAPAAATASALREIFPGIRGQLNTTSDTTSLYVSGEMSALTTATDRITVVRLAAGARPAVKALAVVHAIDQMLTATGRHLLHGAALALPNDPKRAILIFAPSGAGKTTTSLSLARYGFALLTDDAIVLEGGGQSDASRRTVWGLPRALKIHWRTAELLPFLQSLTKSEWDNQGEQSLTLEDLAGVVDVGGTSPREVAACVILGQRSKGAHLLQGMKKSDAMAHITLDNVGRLEGIVPSGQVSRFNAIGDLLKDAITLELRVGMPLEGLSAALLSAIATNSKI